MVVNKKKKNNLGYGSYFLYNDNLVSPIPQASNSTTPTITSEEANSVTPSLTNSPVTPDATLTGSNKNTNIETLSPCNCRSALLNVNSSKNDIFKAEAQLSPLKSHVYCELSILRNQMEYFTEHTKMSLDHENRNTGALHKNIVFLQNELTEKNKIIKSLMETQTAVVDVMKDLRQQLNTPEQNIPEHPSQDKFNQRSRNCRNKDHSIVEQCKRNQQVGKEKKIMYLGNLHENVT